MADEKTNETPDLGKLVEAAVAKHGDNTSALKALVSDNYALRDDLKAVRAKLPPDGAIVLTGDEAKSWGAYQALGKPSDVRKAIEEGETAGKRVTAFEREKHHAEVAAAVGYNPGALHRLAEGDGLTVVLKDEKDKTGKPVKAAYVQGEGDKQTPLTEYAEAHWPEFLPSLRPDAKTSTPRPPGTPPRSDTPRPTGERATAAPSGADRLRASSRYARM